VIELSDCIEKVSDGWGVQGYLVKLPGGGTSGFIYARDEAIFRARMEWPLAIDDCSDAALSATEGKNMTDQDVRKLVSAIEAFIDAKIDEALDRDGVDLDDERRDLHRKLADALNVGVSA
jgi:hypothetical protein